MTDVQINTYIYFIIVIKRIVQFIIQNYWIYLPRLGLARVSGRESIN